MRPLLSLLGLALLLVGCHWDQPYGTYDDWDDNGDQSLDNEEFQQWASESGYYDAWDGDGDGLITDLEYKDGELQVLDFDDDGFLSIGEWEDITSDADGRGAVYGTFETVDEDNNDLLSPAEYEAFVEYSATGNYRDWDTDGDLVLQNAEFYDGLFDTWDTNENGRIDEAEWTDMMDDWAIN